MQRLIADKNWETVTADKLLEMHNTVVYPCIIIIIQQCDKLHCKHRIVYILNAEEC